MQKAGLGNKGSIARVSPHKKVQFQHKYLQRVGDTGDVPHPHQPGAAGTGSR